jgi:hypothetical protein
LRRYPLVLALSLGIAGAASGQTGVRLYPGTDFPGNDVAKAAASSVDECTQLCLHDDRCGAFTFNQKVSRCYLKSRAGNVVGTMTATSGVVASRVGSGAADAGQPTPAGPAVKLTPDNP